VAGSIFRGDAREEQSGGQELYAVSVKSGLDFVLAELPVYNVKLYEQSRATGVGLCQER
jgi:hypothetical protein